MGWLALPIVTLFRFIERLAKIGALIALMLLGAVAFGTDAPAVVHDPPLVIAPAATILAVALLLVALIRSDIEHRGASLVDDLTGLWNRRAFTSTHRPSSRGRSAVATRARRSCSTSTRSS